MPAATVSAFTIIKLLVNQKGCSDLNRNFTQLLDSKYIGMEAFQMDLLSHMEQHEVLLAKLYETFAQRLPEYEEFWLSLAQEEIMHSLWIRNFAGKISQGQLTMEPTNVTLPAIKTSLGSLEKIIESLEGKNIDMTYALSVAMDYENSTIEKYAMEHYTSISVLFGNLLDRLRSASETHLDMVNSAFNLQRKSSAVSKILK